MHTHGLQTLVTGFLLASAVAAGAQEASIPCNAGDGHNGSALCLSLRVADGQIAVKDFVFKPNGSYGATAVGDDFAAEAKLAMDRLPKPCALVMTPEHFARYRAAPTQDPAAREVCAFTGPWTTFRDALMNWATTIGRQEEASNVLSEAGLFRPLVTLSDITPLIWPDTNEGFAAVSGIVTFFVADRFDPRSDDTFRIEIRNAPDAETQARRIAALRRWLAPLRQTVFCHEKLRESIRAFYQKIGVAVDIEQLDVKTPFVIVSERPGR
jgi:hypothetical protein